MVKSFFGFTGSLKTLLSRPMFLIRNVGLMESGPILDRARLNRAGGLGVGRRRGKKHEQESGGHRVNAGGAGEAAQERTRSAGPLRAMPSCRVLRYRLARSMPRVRAASLMRQSCRSSTAAT